MRGERVEQTLVRCKFCTHVLRLMQSGETQIHLLASKTLNAASSERSMLAVLLKPARLWGKRKRRARESQPRS